MECINCNRHPRVNLELYHALDMDLDIIGVIEEWRNIEVSFMFLCMLLTQEQVQQLY